MPTGSGMLESHMNAIEEKLVSIARIPANAGHPLHRGTPREAFIREFLEGHLSTNVSIGSGEIVDSNSTSGSPRNQYDIIIYKRNYPRLEFSRGINGFFVESVVATIEIKSTLTYDGVRKAVAAARNAKDLSPSLDIGVSVGWVPPRVLSYVVAYRGPNNMHTVYNWIKRAHADLGIPMSKWDFKDRTTVPGTALDGVFILNKGFVKLDNSPLSLNLLENPLAGTHILSSSISGNIMLFFLLLQEACGNVHGLRFNVAPYLKGISRRSVEII